MDNKLSALQKYFARPFIDAMLLLFLNQLACTDEDSTELRWRLIFFFLEETNTFLTLPI